jgi:hypothetical protein
MSKSGKFQQPDMTNLHTTMEPPLCIPHQSTIEFLDDMVDFSPSSGALWGNSIFSLLPPLEIMKGTESVSNALARSESPAEGTGGALENDNGFTGAAMIQSPSNFTSLVSPLLSECDSEHSEALLDESMASGTTAQDCIPRSETESFTGLTEHKEPRAELVDPLQCSYPVRYTVYLS